jgi:DNA-directed RNA polymerase specialized sigma24 family protein
VVERTCEQQIAAFYAQHAMALQRTVARRAHAAEQTIEDACQVAWATLLRHPDVTLDQRGLAWLATVAAREAWRLASRAREIPAGAYLPGDPEPGILAEPTAAAKTSSSTASADCGSGAPIKAPSGGSTGAAPCRRGSSPRLGRPIIEANVRHCDCCV